MKDPAFLFYSSDFLTGTMFMTDEQIGKYIRLLCAQHQRGHLTQKHMLSICQAHDDDIYAKFKVDPDGLYYNQRLDDEIFKRTKYVESRRSNASKSKSQNKKGQAYAKHMPQHMENENVIEIEDVIIGQNVAEIYPAHFLDFWTAYPRKVKKQDAIKAWNQVKASDYYNGIMSALGVFVASPEWRKDNGQYIPYPASWLRGRRWEDEVTAITDNSFLGIAKREGF